MTPKSISIKSTEGKFGRDVQKGVKLTSGGLHRVLMGRTDGVVRLVDRGAEVSSGHSPPSLGGRPKRVAWSEGSPS